jgi:hypothetical protein
MHDHASSAFGIGGTKTPNRRVWQLAQPKVGVGLQPAHQQKNDHDYQNDANQARRTVAPTAAMGPTGNYANQDQDQDDEKNRA